MDHLTKSQQKVYDFLRQQASTGVPPTVREICTATGLRSTSTVHAHLKTLERLGYISRGAGLNRSIRVEGETPAAQVPILGRVTAGMPILAVEDIEGYLPFPQKPGKELFALHVSGLSMRDAGILDGDYVVAERVSHRRRRGHCGGHDRRRGHGQAAVPGKEPGAAPAGEPGLSAHLFRPCLRTGEGYRGDAVLLKTNKQKRGCAWGGGLFFVIPGSDSPPGA